MTYESDVSSIICMRSEHEQREHMDLEDPAAYRELRLLSEVHRSPHATQRDLSGRVGIALGLTNMLLHNLAGKGYVRVTRAGWKRWLYALTPTGFSRKIQLTAGYIQRVLGHYQRVKETLREELELVSLNEESRVAIYGTGEFAELVYLALREMRIEEVDIFASGAQPGSSFLGMPVHDLSTMQPELYDRLVVARLRNSNDDLLKLREIGVSPQKLVTFFAYSEPLEEE